MEKRSQRRYRATRRKGNSEKKHRNGTQERKKCCTDYWKDGWKARRVKKMEICVCACEGERGRGRVIRSDNDVKEEGREEKGEEATTGRRQKNIGGKKDMEGRKKVKDEE